MMIKTMEEKLAKSLAANLIGPRSLAICLFCGVWLGATVVLAQLNTTGQIQGIVKSKGTGELLAGVTVVVTGPKMQGTKAELTDDAGQYTVTDLPPGVYEVTFFYSDATVKRTNIEVNVNKTAAVHVEIGTGSGEVVVIEERAPAIDATSTKRSMTISEDYTKNVPVRGRNYTSTLDAAAGAASDGLGTGFSGSQSLENNYVIDGISTTGVSVGGVGSLLLNNFIQEVEIITGGYDAEFGRSTGGVVNVVTKSGSNEFHGSVWMNWEPGVLQARREPIFSELSAITREVVPDKALGYMDFGADLGGPIIRDKLWFYVGFAPILARTDIVRKISTQVDREENENDYSELGNPDPDDNPMTTRNVGCELTDTCESDDLPDLDPVTGFTKWEEIERSSRQQKTTDFQVNSKINFALSPDHQGSLSGYVSPLSRDSVGIFGTHAVNAANTSWLIGNFSGKWTSKFRNNKTQLDAVAGFFFQNRETRPLASENLNGQPLLDRREADGSITRAATFARVREEPDDTPMSLGLIGRWGTNFRAESDNVLANCTDAGVDRTIADPFPSIKNCPLASYNFNGFGFLSDRSESRLAGRLLWTERIKALGHHELKVGLDVESLGLVNNRQYTGGQAAFSTTGLEWQVQRFATIISPDGDPLGTGDGIPDGNCRTLENESLTCDFQDVQRSTSNTFNGSLFVQDKWQIMPNLTVKAGVRAEQQKLFFADEVRGRDVYRYTAIDDGNPMGLRDQFNIFAGAPCQIPNPDPSTFPGGESDPAYQTARQQYDTFCGPTGNVAMNLNGLIAPRVGILYDWTKESRSKVFANWGRFYQAIPLNINDRSFGGEAFVTMRWDWASECGGGVPDPGGAINDNGDTVSLLPSHPDNCPNAVMGDAPGFNTTVNGLGTLVVPKARAQFLDEYILGAEYEVMEDVVVGLAYQNRRLGRVIEDVSTDGASTYVIANPGEFDQDAESDMENRIAGLRQDNPMDPEIPLLEKQLQDFKKIRRFPKPKREYNAIEFTAKKRYSKNFFVQGSYTYSTLRGNHPGVFTPNNGQVDPNINSQYDLLELLANRNGILPGDRPHNFKLDGYYTFDMKEQGTVTTGARLRALSGVTVDALGSHFNYGIAESFVLPRGSQGRTDFITSADLHLAYGRGVGHNMVLEVYFDLFNVMNQQIQLGVDDLYTFDRVNPISGGDTTDLPYAKQVDPIDGSETSTLVSRNRNYKNTTVRSIPLYGRFGLRLTF